MAVDAASKAVGRLSSQGIDTSAFHMIKELDIRSDQKRLENLLDLAGGTYKVNLIDFDQVDRKWIVGFEDKDAIKPWSHLTHWAGFPLEKKVMIIEAQ